MRASTKRSSTNALMRIDSRSMRAISSLVSLSPVTAPWRWSSANPRIAVSGVLSSCDASATNLRSLPSDSLRAAKDSSMRDNIVLSEPTKRPTSVVGFASGKRADKSPEAICSAVFSTFSSGRIPIRIT